MGAAEEFDAFCRAQHARVVAATFLVCGDLGAAEELAQSAMEQAWVQWPRVSVMASPGGWVQQVAFNLARSGLRRRAAERRARARVGVAGPVVAVDSASVVTVRRVLVGLPERQREVVVHRYYLGRSTAETAAVMGIGEGAVRQLLHRAITSLRVVLDPEEVAEDGR